MLKLNNNNGSFVNNIKNIEQDKQYSTGGN